MLRRDELPATVTRAPEHPVALSALHREHADGAAVVRDEVRKVPLVRWELIADAQLRPSNA
eukprot:7500557-Lingulodinium_polyedra.AAC.1